jgi:Cation/multidrug efflux pump
LVVGWFGSYTTPLAIMIPIPLSLIGIIPAHAISGAFFTATSMIGFIAGAGIVVRNSIILVDFITMRRDQGETLENAVVEAGAVRFRPMVLTALSVVAGAFVILFDPIFQGLAISLWPGSSATLFRAWSCRCCIIWISGGKWQNTTLNLDHETTALPHRLTS